MVPFLAQGEGRRKAISLKSKGTFGTVGQLASTPRAIGGQRVAQCHSTAFVLFSGGQEKRCFRVKGESREANSIPFGSN